MKDYKLSKTILLEAKCLINFPFLIITIILLFSSTCKKKEPTVCSASNTLFFPQDALERMFFRDSSYWIYKDSLTGNLDSIWIYNNSSLNIINMEKIEPSSSGKCFELGTCYFNSTNSGKHNISFSSSPSALGTPVSEERFNIHILQESNLFLFAVLRGLNYYNQYPEYGVMDTIPLLIVNGKQYKNILRKSNIPSISQDLYFTSYFVSKIGIVKFVRNDNSVWELVRFKVKQ